MALPETFTQFARTAAEQLRWKKARPLVEDELLTHLCDQRDALMAGGIAPLFRPLGFGDWRISTALLTGFTAKESVVSTLTLLLGGDTSQITTLFTPFTAAVFLVFVLLYTPCVAAIATVKRELGSARAAAATVLIQCAIAWVMAFLVRSVGLLFGLA